MDGARVIMQLSSTRACAFDRGGREPASARQRTERLRCTVPLRNASSSAAMLMLINAGADVNQADNDGNCAAHWAARSGRVDNLKFLLEHGAQFNQRNNAGKTVFGVAAAEYGCLRNDAMVAGLGRRHWCDRHYGGAWCRFVGFTVAALAGCQFEWRGRTWQYCVPPCARRVARSRCCLRSVRLRL
jgi:hypothetical protein